MKLAITFGHNGISCPLTTELGLEILISISQQSNLVIFPTIFQYYSVFLILKNQSR